MKRLPLFVTFLFFVGACASIAFWTMRLYKPQARPIVAPPPPPPPEVTLEAAKKLFGTAAVAAAVSTNYQLKGVIDAHNGRDGVAILASDGNPAQAYGVGVQIAPGVSVQEVHANYIMLSEGGVLKRIDLPEVVSNAADLVPNAVTPASRTMSATTPAVSRNDRGSTSRITPPGDVRDTRNASGNVSARDDRRDDRRDDGRDRTSLPQAVNAQAASRQAPPRGDESRSDINQNRNAAPPPRAASARIDRNPPDSGH